MGNTPADQFLDAFNEIETWLQGTLQEDKTTGFAQPVRQQASRTSGPVRTHNAIYDIPNREQVEKNRSRKKNLAARLPPL